MGTEDAIEREVQRRLAERSGSAGLVSPGRISLEVLFMLPPDFVRAYTSLFDRSLKESVVSAGAKDEAVTKKLSTTPRLSARGKRKIRDGAGARSSSRRYREHWVVRDEKSFRFKSTVDRKLKRLAREIAGQLRTVEGPDGKLIDTSSPVTFLCARCQVDLAPHAELGYKIGWCPRCGQQITK